MALGAPEDEIVLDTKWFQVVARRPPGYADPHFSLKTHDYVGIVAVNSRGEFLLVRQFRPTVWQTTLEIPSGHVDPGQTPEEAARMELFEETGYEAEKFELLGDFSPDTGRLGNRMWGFFAGNAVPTCNPAYKPEQGIETVIYRGGIHDLVREKDFCSALNRALLFAAVMQGKLKL
ncbi:MAG: NUDIX hydrolase [Verrucomicrobia bacterium]|nr:MAG: NUDIX hydrolase [Verrucomicrobiota bacterium]